MEKTLYLNNSIVKIRELTQDDYDTVVDIDNSSGFHLRQWISDYESPDDNNGYAWGVEINGALIGYCTIGGADDVCETIENYKSYNHSYDLLLSDVFIYPNYRHKNYGTTMIKEAISMRLTIEPNCMNIFCEPMNFNLYTFYEKCNFESIGDCMVAKANKFKILEYEDIEK